MHSKFNFDFFKEHFWYFKIKLSENGIPSIKALI